MFFVFQRALINEYSEGIAIWFPSITLTGYLPISIIYVCMITPSQPLGHNRATDIYFFVFDDCFLFLCGNASRSQWCVYLHFCNSCPDDERHQQTNRK